MKSFSSAGRSGVVQSPSMKASAKPMSPLFSAAEHALQSSSRSRARLALGQAAEVHLRAVGQLHVQRAEAQLAQQAEDGAGGRGGRVSGRASGVWLVSVVVMGGGGQRVGGQRVTKASGGAGLPKKGTRLIHSEARASGCGR
jgi:hypothetical protein